MRNTVSFFCRKTFLTSLLSASLVVTIFASAGNDRYDKDRKQGVEKFKNTKVELGPRPFFLVDDMDESYLKHRLKNCSRGPFKSSDFSIGHRGAALQFPEHTKESYEAAAIMGAGIVECDVTFTQDQALVCRHSQCDLHTTTNILETELAEKCSLPFEPTQFDLDGNLIKPATARCCTSDISLDEFKSLQGKMDAFNPRATTVTDYLAGTAAWRTDLYANRGTLLSHKESIELFKKLNVKMTPELKEASVAMPFNGLTQQAYAQKMLDEYREAGVPPYKVFPQSFNLEDVRYWIKNNYVFGRQAVYLDGRYETADFDFRDSATWQPSMEQLVAEGVKIIAPPTFMLVEVENGKIVPSDYALAAKAAGLDIITWTLERSGPLANGGGFYYQSIDGSNPKPTNPETGVINNDGDMMVLLDVLARKVGVKGVFSDWPATTSYYANCMNIR